MFPAGAAEPCGSLPRAESEVGAGAHFRVLGGMSRIQHSPQMELHWPTDAQMFSRLFTLNELRVVRLMHEAHHGFYRQLQRPLMIINDTVR